MIYTSLVSTYIKQGVKINFLQVFFIASIVYILMHYYLYSSERFCDKYKHYLYYVMLFDIIFAYILCCKHNKKIAEEEKMVCVLGEQCNQGGQCNQNVQCNPTNPPCNPTNPQCNTPNPPCNPPYNPSNPQCIPIFANVVPQMYVPPSGDEYVCVKKEDRHSDRHGERHKDKHSHKTDTLTPPPPKEPSICKEENIDSTDDILDDTRNKPISAPSKCSEPDDTSIPIFVRK